MDAIALLKADHQQVKDLFDQVEELSETAHATRGKLFAKIAHELTIHCEIEERIFYPAVKAKTKRNTEENDEVLEAYEEHANAKEMIRKLEALSPTDQTYHAKLNVLMEMVRHHLQEEEGDFFKDVRSLLPREELRELGEQLAQLKEQLQGQLQGRRENTPTPA